MYAEAPGVNPDDLLQIPGRIAWYESRFCADDMPDWNPALFLRSLQVTPDLRAVTLSMEISRERVPLRNAYKCVGQRASLRVNQGLEFSCTVASAPFPEQLNKVALFNVRGDLFADEIKKVKEKTTVMAEITVLVTKKEAPEVYNLSELDALESGPFGGAGINLRGSPLMAVFRYPTLVVFVSGRGIASAKALIEASPDVASLNFAFRRDVRLYYKAQNDANLCFKDRAAAWEEAGVQVHTTTRSFQDAFDDDDTLTYDPEYTGAIILTGGDAEALAEAMEVCKDAEITELLTDAVEQKDPVFLASTPKTFMAYKRD